MNNPDAINKMYRDNDIRRWREMDFVVGYEIKLSNNPKYDCEICKALSGKYPKNFNWNGWHDGCHCYITPVFMDDETSEKQTVSDLRAALHGTEREKFSAENEIKYVPLNFLNWNIQEGYLSSRGEDRPYYIVENWGIILKSYEHYKNKGR